MRDRAPQLTSATMRFLPKYRALLGGIVLCQASAFRPLFTSNFAWNAAHRHSGVACSKMRPAARTSPRMGFKSPFVALKEGIARTLAGDYDEKTVKEAIGQYTEESKVVVFSWTRSPFCKKAKGLLTDLLADPSDYKFVELDEREDGNAIRYELSQMTGRTSVPHIWINGEFVGGCNDGPGVTTLMDRGELVPKLEAAGCRLK